MVAWNWDSLRERIVDQFAMGSHSVHGLAHWERVDAWGQRLVTQTSGADLLVVRLFALYHDSRRLNEFTDPDHGRRGGQLARGTHGDWFEVTDPQLELLIAACERHELGDISDDPTIGCCWDADRLDLPRVGIQPSPEFMSTTAGREWTQRRPRVW